MEFVSVGKMEEKCISDEEETPEDLFIFDPKNATTVEDDVINIVKEESHFYFGTEFTDDQMNMTLTTSDQSLESSFRNRNKENEPSVNTINCRKKRPLEDGTRSNDGKKVCRSGAEDVLSQTSKVPSNKLLSQEKFPKTKSSTVDSQAFHACTQTPIQQADNLESAYEPEENEISSGKDLLMVRLSKMEFEMKKSAEAWSTLQNLPQQIQRLETKISNLVEVVMNNQLYLQELLEKLLGINLTASKSGLQVISPDQLQETFGRLCQSSVMGDDGTSAISRLTYQGDMTCSKRRKVDDENRSFKEKWIQQYAFILPPTSSKPICLICSETIALVKSSNMKRHYETKHSGFEKMYQQGTEERENTINKLKSQYEMSTIVLANTMTAQERAMECSLRIPWILGRHKKPITDAEVVKECMLETANTLFDDKQKNEIKDKIKQIPLSDSTLMRRAKLLADDLISQLDLGLKKSPCISLAIDESTDSTDNAQLVVFVRYYDAGKKEFCQDLLGVTDLKGRTQREDIYGSLRSMLESRNIDVKSIFSLTTDGAPAMVCQEGGLVARLKKDNPDMITYHCIIHQSVLCASLGDEYGEVMETIMKLVNFLRSTSALQHRLLGTFLTEVNASYDDLLVHNNARWLSKGRVLERFWAVRKKLLTFLENQDSVKAKAFSEFLKDDKKMESVGFLTDIMSHLNDLNVKLQGEKHTIFKLISAIRAFQKKLELFNNDIQSQLFHFPRLLEQRKGETDIKYIQFIKKLINNFKVRFDDFVLGKQLLLFIQNPFLVTDITQFSVEAKLTCKWVDAAKIQLELIDFQENVELKQILYDCAPETFWSKEGLPANFPTLHRLAVQILTMFGSTYCCESAFSTMNFMKNKFRSCMTSEHLHHSLRLSITPLVPRFRELTRSKKCNFSH